MNELNDVIESVLLDIENLQGAMRVFEMAFSRDGAFCEISEKELSATFGAMCGNLERIHEKTNKALEVGMAIEGGNV